MRGCLSKILDRIVGLGCLVVGWLAGLTVFRLGSAGQIRVLRGLSRIIAAALSVPALRSAFRSYQGNQVSGDVPAHAPRRRSDRGEADDEDAAVLFSGGKDSLYVAWELSRRFRTIHLLTLRMSTIEGGERCESGVRLLNASPAGNRFVHHYLDARALAQDLLFDRQRENRERFGATVVGAACVPCRVVMETSAIAFCRQRDLHWVGFGLNPASRDSFNQSRRAVEMGEEFAGRYGVNLVFPLWERPDIDPLAELRRGGVVADTPIGKPYEFGFKNATQGFCPFGIWCDINMRRHEFVHGSDHYHALCERYRRHVEGLCERHLDEAHGIRPVGP